MDASRRVNKRVGARVPLQRSQIFKDKGVTFAYTY